MRSNYLAASALLASGALALHPAQRRQAEEIGGAKFTSAANELISDYVPTAVIDEWEQPIMSAASENSVSGEYTEILYSALQASQVPGWFESAVPSQYEEQYAALTSGIEEIRGAATDVAESVEESVSSARDEISSRVEDVESRASDFTSNVESKATDVASDIESGATSVATDVVDGVTSVFTRVEDGVTSVISEIIGTETSEGWAARQTAAVGGALMAGLGLVMAL